MTWRAGLNSSLTFGEGNKKKTPATAEPNQAELDAMGAGETQPQKTRKVGKCRIELPSQQPFHSRSTTVSQPFHHRSTTVPQPFHNRSTTFHNRSTTIPQLCINVPATVPAAVPIKLTPVLKVPGSSA